MRIVGYLRELSGNNRLAIVLIVVGVAYGVDAFLPVNIVPRLWPLFVTMTGIGLSGMFFARHRRDCFYLETGVMLLCFSGLALYCNFAGWSTLGRLWPLFVGFAGVSHLLGDVLCRRSRTYLPGLLLLSACIVFFLVFGIGGYLWWTSLILAGASLLVAEWLR